MKKTLTKIYSMMLVVCMLTSMFTFTVNAETTTGSTEFDPNLIYYRDFEGETHKGDGSTRLAANNTSTDWVWSYSGSTFATQTIDSSTVMVESGSGGDSNVYRLANPVTSGRFYLSMDIGFTNLGTAWENAAVTFYTQEYPADNGGGYAAFNQYGRGYAVKISGRNEEYDANYPNGYMNVYAGSASDGFASTGSSTAQLYMAPDKLHRLDVVYNLDSPWCVISLDGTTMLNAAVPADYAAEQITAIGLLTKKGMFFDNIRIATKPDNSFDAAIENMTSTGFDLKFNHSVHSLATENVLVNNVAATSVTKKNCDTYTVVCAEDPANAYIELVNVKNFMGESPKTTSFGEKVAVTAEIVLETTNATLADGETVPMGETMMIKMTGAEPTGYSWYYEGQTKVRSTEATFRAPANYSDGGVERSVCCDVTYAGGKITTAAVKLEPYVNNKPTSYWNLNTANPEGKQFYKSWGFLENSDTDYVFYVDGKGFLLAKEQNVKKSAYFIMALDAYGDIYSGDESTTSETAWKNYIGISGFKKADDGTTMQTKLLGEGNTFDALADDGDATYALPDIFDAYIDMNHSWPFSSDKQASVNAITSGVALPSLSDYVNNKERVGYKDNLQAIAVGKPTLLRDLVAKTDQTYTNVAGQVIASEGSDTSNSGPYLVRPVFWLAKDFFEKNAIDLELAGSGVIDIINNETYTNQETVKATYKAAGKEDLYNKYIGPKAAEIVLETTNATLADGETVPMGETMMIKTTGIKPTGYSWYYEGQTKVRSTEATFRAPANYSDGGVERSVCCDVTYAGGKITTAAVKLEPYVNNKPTSYWNLNTANPEGKQFYKSWGFLENSDTDYVFYVDGKGFLLAKEQNVKKSAYFIMALDAYGDIYSGDESTTSETAWKNYIGISGFKKADDGTTMQTKLLGEGNTFDALADDGDATYALPDVFDAYIDMNHSWPFSSDKQASVNAITSGVALPSLSDYVNNKERVGYKDNLQAIAVGKPTLLRDLVAKTDQTYTNVAGQVIASEGSDTSNSGPYLVRPVFWLAKDFFEKNAIDLELAGSGVIDIINNETYTNQETVKATYKAAGKEDLYNKYIGQKTAEIILETTNATLADGETVPMGETMMIKTTGIKPTGYKWYYSGSATVRSTEATFRPLANYSDGGVERSVYCDVTYAGGTVTTAAVKLEPYVNNKPTSYWNLNQANPENQKFHKNWGFLENSDTDYVFYVDGKGFLLAKEQNVKKSAYFIMALDAYGDIYSGTENTADVPIISETAWKNYMGVTGFKKADDGTTMQTKLLGEGNTFDALADDGDATYALPDVFDAYIDMNHSWPFSSDNQASVNAITSGVALPSLSDYVNNKERVGYKDNLQAIAGDKPTLLRDLIAKTEQTYTNAAGQVITAAGLDTSNSGPYLVRPVFWLSKDFFEKNAIDLTKAGSGVIDIIKNSTYTDQETAAKTYADAGMEFEYNIYVNGSFAEGISSTDAVWTDKDGNETTLATATSIKASLTITNGNETAQPAVIFVAAYGADDTLLGVNLVNGISIPAKGAVPVECAIEGLTAGTVTKAQIMVWESVTNPVPLLAPKTF